MIFLRLGILEILGDCKGNVLYINQHTGSNSVGFQPRVLPSAFWGQILLAVFAASCQVPTNFTSPIAWL